MPDLPDRVSLLRDQYQRGSALRERLVWPLGGVPTTPAEAAKQAVDARRAVCQWAKRAWELLNEHFEAFERDFYGPGERGLGGSLFFMSCEEEIAANGGDVSAYLEAKLDLIGRVLDRFDRPGTAVSGEERPASMARDKAHSDSRARAAVAWFMALVGLVGAGAIILTEQSYGHAAAATGVAGVAISVALTLASWPDSRKPTTAAVFIGIAFAALGTAATIAALSGENNNSTRDVNDESSLTDAQILQEAQALGLKRVANCHIDFRGGGIEGRMMVFRPRSPLSELSDEVRIYEMRRRGLHLEFSYRPQPVLLGAPNLPIRRGDRQSLTADVRAIKDLDGVTGSEAIIDFYETAIERVWPRPYYLAWSPSHHSYRITPLLAPETTGRKTMQSVLNRRYSATRDYVRLLFRWVYSTPIEVVDATGMNSVTQSFAVQGYVPTRENASDPRALSGGAISLVTAYFIRGRTYGDVDLLQIVPWEVDLTGERITARGYGWRLEPVPFDRGRPINVQLSNAIAREGWPPPLPRPDECRVS